jgi:hypothetical protein
MKQFFPDLPEKMLPDEKKKKPEAKILPAEGKEKFNFTQFLINKLYTTDDIPLPKDLIDTIYALNTRVRNQANAIIKPSKGMTI